MIREAGSGRVGGLGEIRHRPGRTKATAVCDGTVRQLQNGLTAYLEYDNQERPPQSLNYPHRPQSNPCSDQGRPHPPGCTLFFPFRGPSIATYHSFQLPGDDQRHSVSPLHTLTTAVDDSGSGIGSPSSFNPSRWKATASDIC